MGSKVQPQRARRGRGDAPSAGAPRASLYDEVTAKIVAELEAGTFPWVRPWGQAGAGRPGLPRNAVTGRTYSGINILLLWGAVFAHGYASQNWLTFRQALAAGGNVRKGERGTPVVYADRFTPEAEKERARETGEDARAVPFLKRFTVFNLDQCEGLDRLAPEPAPLPEREIVPRAEALIAASGADLRIGGDSAFYDPQADYERVRLPFGLRLERDLFFDSRFRLSVWAAFARRAGSILLAESLLRRVSPPGDAPDPPADPGEG